MRLDNICELVIDGCIAKIIKSQNNSILQYVYMPIETKKPQECCHHDSVWGAAKGTGY